MTTLTKEQIELGAMWLATHNTGWSQMPTNKQDIQVFYAQRSGEYYEELGEGLEAERKMFVKELNKGRHVDSLQKQVPFLFETA